MTLSFDRADLTAGCVVHVFNRGNDKRILFKSDRDYNWFLNKAQTLDMDEYFEIIAFCLMPNHFHYFLRLKTDKKIGAFFQRLQLAYAKYYNRKYQRTGHVFTGRFKATALNDLEHFSYLPKYIHLNPVKAGLAEKSEDWKFSNYRDLINSNDVKEHQFYIDTYGSISEYIKYVNGDEVNASTDFKAILLE